MYDIQGLIEEPELVAQLRRSVASGTPPTFIRSAKLKLTARCNLRCQMCRYGRGAEPPELETARWFGVVTELAALGCRKVHLSGGEVLLRPDLEAIVAHAVAAHLKVTITSNLTLLTKARAKSLLRSRVGGLSTSLDAATPKRHDAIRGVAGSFRRTLRGLHLIQQHPHAARTRVRVNFVMMRDNFRDYPAVVALASAHGATEVVPMPVDTKRARVRLSKRLIREYNAEVAPAVLAARASAGMSVDDAQVYPFGRDAEQLREAAAGDYAGGYYRAAPCYAPFLHLFGAWDGRVYPCCMTNGRIAPLGDLARQSVAEIFRGAPFEAARATALRERWPSCHACDMYLADNRLISKAIAGS
jgi:MoaA/NifB/PqqE/SkfB family radical SAM enzyme